MNPKAARSRMDGEGGGKEALEGGSHIPVANPCWCLAETNIIHNTIILQLKFILKRENGD